MRYPARCSSCAQLLEPGTKAFHDRASRAVTCVRCANPSIEGAREPAAEAPEVGNWVVGEPGRGVQAAYDRRRASHDERLKQRWGRLAPVARVFGSEPQHVTAFRKGAEGERKLAERLERAVGDVASLLHSRRIPRGDIDHIAIAPSGIFVIDAKHYDGRVDVRDVGGWRKTDWRLFVQGRDKSALIDGAKKQAGAVQRAIEPTELRGTPIHSRLCFIDADWSLFAKPIEIDGVTALWRKRLCEEIKRPGPLTADQRERLAVVLSAALPATR